MILHFQNFKRSMTLDLALDSTESFRPFATALDTQRTESFERVLDQDFSFSASRFGMSLTKKNYN